MSQRIKHLYNWKPLTKKGQPTSAHSLQVPQPVGIPGWLLLTHNKDHQPCALFIDAKESSPAEDVPIVFDDRLCSDTVLRVIRLNKTMFACCDIYVLCGRKVHETMNYGQRSERLQELLDTLHSPDLTALVHISELPVGTILRGREYYDDQPGSIGVFLPAVE